MRKLDKDTLSRLNAAASDLFDIKSKIDGLVRELNDKLVDLTEEWESARQDAYSVIDDACNEAQSYFDEKSEKWQESDTGQQYQDWVNELETLRDTLDYEAKIEVELLCSDDMEELFTALNENVREAPDE